MIKILTTCILSLLICGVHAQTIKTDKQNEIINDELRREVENYERYLKTFSAKHKISQYVISVNEKKDGDFDIYKLDAILYENTASSFNPSSYALANNVPVLIQGNTTQVGSKNNLRKIDSSNQTYWKNKEKKYEKLKPGELLDSVVVYDDKGPKKISTAGFMRVIYPKTQYTSEPKSIVLTFKNGKFISSAVGHAERSVQ